MGPAGWLTTRVPIRKQTSTVCERKDPMTESELEKTQTEWELRQQVRDLQEENKRLRETLNDFLSRPCECLGWPPFCDSCTARAALRG